MSTALKLLAVRFSEEKIIEKMQILGTNINDAVQRGMLELRNTAGRRRPLSSVILLLTDGQATHGETDQNTITRNARTANSNSQIILHSIAFGEFTLKLLKFTQLTGGSADYQLMKDLSMDNEGVARMKDTLSL